MLKLKRILVLGATGNIGKAVLAQLLHKGYTDIQCFVKGNSEITQLEAISENLSYRRGDILDRTSLKYAMKNKDVIINCSGLNSFWAPCKSKYSEINVLGTRNVMEIALLTKVKKIIHVSTYWALGLPKDSPLTEESEVGSHSSRYARTKFLGDYLAWELYKNKSLPIVFIYLASVLNGENRNDLLSIKRFIRSETLLMVNSPYQFVFIYIKDAAKAIINAINVKTNIGKKYLLGNESLSIKDLFKLVSRISGKAMPKRELGKRMSLFISRMMNLWSKFSKKPPLLSYDFIKTIYKGSLLFDGSKTEKELGIKYTPIETALKEIINEKRRYF